MDTGEKRKVVRELRLAGETVDAIAAKVGVTRAYVYELLKPTAEDPLTIRSCAHCKRLFETDKVGYGWCSEVCYNASRGRKKEAQEKSENGERGVRVVIDPEVWLALGKEPEKVTGETVRGLLRKLAEGVLRQKSRNQ